LDSLHSLTSLTSLTSLHFTSLTSLHSRQKEQPAAQETEVLHEKLKIVLQQKILKKKSRPPTSPNFKTRKTFVLHNCNYITCKVYTYPITYLSFIKI